jgi:hypothetical protein
MRPGAHIQAARPLHDCPNEFRFPISYGIDTVVLPFAATETFPIVVQCIV